MITEKIERVRNDLSRNQRKDLVQKLQQEGFKVRASGYIVVRDLKPNHPKEFHLPRDLPLPVGFLDRNYASLVNTDKNFPEDYHAKLMWIYQSI